MISRLNAKANLEFWPTPALAIADWEDVMSKGWETIDLTLIFQVAALQLELNTLHTSCDEFICLALRFPQYMLEIRVFEAFRTERQLANSVRSRYCFEWSSSDDTRVRPLVTG